MEDNNKLSKEEINFWNNTPEESNAKKSNLEMNQDISHSKDIPEHTEVLYHSYDKDKKK